MASKFGKSGDIKRSGWCAYCKRLVAVTHNPAHRFGILIPHTGSRGLCQGSGTQPKRHR